MPQPLAIGTRDYLLPGVWKAATTMALSAKGLHGHSGLKGKYLLYLSTGIPGIPLWKRLETRNGRLEAETLV